MISLLEKLMTEEEVHDKWVVFDFDGVCSSYKKGWQGSDVFGDPVEGVADLISELRRDGFKVSLFTTRGETPALKDWLSTNRFVFDSINDTSHNPEDAGTAKPIAELYVDDRAVRFNEDDVEASIVDIKSKLSANESLMVRNNGDFYIDRAAALLEDFKDQFKPISDEELGRRVDSMSDDEILEELVLYIEDDPTERFQLFDFDIGKWFVTEMVSAMENMDLNDLEDMHTKHYGGDSYKKAMYENSDAQKRREVFKELFMSGGLD